jgi:DNA-binding YbaB/EbfC family protein
LNKIMQQAQEMQTRMLAAQEKVEETEAEGVAGAGLVKVTLRGKGDMIGLAIDPSLMGDDVEIIEDLVKAAYGDARRRLDNAVQEAMQDATKGLGDGMMPGFKMPF